MVKGKPRKKCSATIKKVGKHFTVKTTCSLAKMHVTATRKTGKSRKHRKPRGCGDLSPRACKEMKRIEAKEYHLQT